MLDDEPEVTFSDSAAWRAWLTENHDRGASAPGSRVRSKMGDLAPGDDH